MDYQAQAAKYEAQKARFSVKTSRFSMGDDMRVEWIDGPTSSQVDAIIQRYKSGDFDGMTDSYDYRKDHAWTDAFGDAKYIFANREYSDSAIAGAIRTVTQRYHFDGIKVPSVEDYQQGRAWNIPSPIIGGELRNRSDWGSLIRQELSKRTWCL
jgi:hypothetical protein